MNGHKAFGKIQSLPKISFKDGEEEFAECVRREVWDRNSSPKMSSRHTKAIWRGVGEFLVRSRSILWCENPLLGI